MVVWPNKSAAGFSPFTANENIRATVRRVVVKEVFCVSDDKPQAPTREKLFINTLFRMAAASSPLG